MKPLERMTVNPDVVTGKPCLRGMRITVSTILGLLAAGASHEEILRNYLFLEEASLPWRLIVTGPAFCRLAIES